MRLLSHPICQIKILLELLAIEGISHFSRHLTHLQIFSVLLVQRLVVVSLLLNFREPSLVGYGEFRFFRHLSLVIDPIRKVILSSSVDEIAYS